MTSREKALKDKNGGVKVYTTNNGKNITKIYACGSKHSYGDIYQNDGLELDEEGKKLLLALKCRGYEISYDYDE